MTPDSSLEAFRKEAVARTPAAKMAPALAAVQVDGLLETLMEERMQQQLGLLREEIMEVLTNKLQEALCAGQQGDDSEEELPPAVKCYGGKLHIPLTSDVCFCGYPWATRRACAHEGPVPVQANEGALSDWCSRCLAAVN